MPLLLSVWVPHSVQNHEQVTLNLFFIRIVHVIWLLFARMHSLFYSFLPNRFLSAMSAMWECPPRTSIMTLICFTVVKHSCLCWSSFPWLASFVLFLLFSVGNPRAAESHISLSLSHSLCLFVSLSLSLVMKTKRIKIKKSPWINPSLRELIVQLVTS